MTETIVVLIFLLFWVPPLLAASAMGYATWTGGIPRWCVTFIVVTASANGFFGLWFKLLAWASNSY